MACMKNIDALLELSQEKARELGHALVEHLVEYRARMGSLPVYQNGLQDVQKTTAELFPGVTRFSAANEEQKLKIFSHIVQESERPESGARRLAPGASPDFFQTLRIHTIFGFLVDPEGGGNRDFVGWKAIGRDPSHSFSAPFGFYDKDYPGWQPVSGETEKK